MSTLNSEYNHNHSTKGLTFKSIQSEDYQHLFAKGMSSSVAHADVLREWRCRLPSGIVLHQAKAGRGICPKKRDVDVFYRKYCAEYSEVKFERMEATSVDFMKKKPGTFFKCQNYDSVESKPLIIAILTPLMQRFIQWSNSHRS